MINIDRVEELGRELLIAIGENPDREGLVDTPKRWANMWREFIDYDAGVVDRMFDVGNSDQIVAVSGIKVWSLCEHHLLPFSSTVNIGYIPNGTVLGLSKFGRIAHEAAHGLQVQERLSEQIADRITAITGTEDVAVTAKGEHLCMTMRGIRTPATMHTSVMRGVFRDEPEARAEFMTLING